jgi:hypothetical protein
LAASFRTLRSLARFLALFSSAATDSWVTFKSREWNNEDKYLAYLSTCSQQA